MLDSSLPATTAAMSCATDGVEDDAVVAVTAAYDGAGGTDDGAGAAKCTVRLDGVAVGAGVAAGVDADGGIVDKADGSVPAGVDGVAAGTLFISSRSTLVLPETVLDGGTIIFSCSRSVVAMVSATDEANAV